MIKLEIRVTGLLQYNRLVSLLRLVLLWNGIRLSGIEIGETLTVAGTFGPAAVGFGDRKIFLMANSQSSTAVAQMRHCNADQPSRKHMKEEKEAT